MDQDKRKLRQMKRAIKRAGSKHRRRDLKRQLHENPDDAHLGEETFGGSSSDGLHVDGTAPADEY